MTRRYIVTGVKVRFGPGFVLELDKAQADTRLHCLKKLKKDRYRVLDFVEFKQSEVIGVVEGDIPKSFRDRLREAYGELDAETENGGESEEETPDGALTLKHRYFGKYDVVDSGGAVLTEEPLPKEEAQAYLEDMQGGEA